MLAIRWSSLCFERQICLVSCKHQQEHLADTYCSLQVSTLRQRLAALEQELKTSDKQAFLNSIAAEEAAELAALPLHEPTEEVLPAKQTVKSNGKAKSRPKKLQKQSIKPKMDELADAERKPRLFEPAVGPPPRVGKEELQAEGTGHEILLQVGRITACSLQYIHQNVLCIVLSSRLWRVIVLGACLLDAPCTWPMCSHI